MRQKEFDLSVLRKERKELIKQIDKYGDLTVKGTIRYLCGDLISRGMNRDVYVLKLNPNWVVKIQKTIHFDNVIEYLLWDEIRFAPSYAKWFAECLTISETGSVLIQRRVEHKEISKYPKKVPNYFTDFKIQNYGWIGRRFVCCDYAGVLGMLTGIVTNNMKTVKWYVGVRQSPKRGKKISLRTKNI